MKHTFRMILIEFDLIWFDFSCAEDLNCLPSDPSSIKTSPSIRAAAAPATLSTTSGRDATATSTTTATSSTTTMQPYPHHVDTSEAMSSSVWPQWALADNPSRSAPLLPGAGGPAPPADGGPAGPAGRSGGGSQDDESNYASQLRSSMAALLNGHMRQSSTTSTTSNFSSYSSEEFRLG